MSVGTSRSGVRTWRRQRLDRPSNWKPPPDIPDSWRALIDRYERESWRRVFVIGPMDAGKSTFCHCLARTTVTPTLLDCDLGQKMIGPPGCVTLGRLDPTGALYLLRMHFVGQVHPVGNAASVVAGLARLARTTGVERLVVNSSGLITDSGIALKRAKIDALAPDAVIAIERSDELQPILSALPASRVLRIRPSPLARSRNAAERRRNRSAGLAEAFPRLSATHLPDAALEGLLAIPPSDDVLRLCALAGPSGNDRALGLIRVNQFAADGLVWTGNQTQAGPVHRIRVGMQVSSQDIDPCRTTAVRAG